MERLVAFYSFHQVNSTHHKKVKPEEIVEVSFGVTLDEYSPSPLSSISSLSAILDCEDDISKPPIGLASFSFHLGSKQEDFDKVEVMTIHRSSSLPYSSPSASTPASAVLTSGINTSSSHPSLSYHPENLLSIACHYRDGGRLLPTPIYKSSTKLENAERTRHLEIFVVQKVGIRMAEDSIVLCLTIYKMPIDLDFKFIPSLVTEHLRCFREHVMDQTVDLLKRQKEVLIDDLICAESKFNEEINRLERRYQARVGRGAHKTGTSGGSSSGSSSSSGACNGTINYSRDNSPYGSRLPSARCELSVLNGSSSSRAPTPHSSSGGAIANISSNNNNNNKGSAAYSPGKSRARSSSTLNSSLGNSSDLSHSSKPAEAVIESLKARIVELENERCNDLFSLRERIEDRRKEKEASVMQRLRLRSPPRYAAPPIPPMRNSSTNRYRDNTPVKAPLSGGTKSSFSSSTTPNGHNTATSGNFASNGTNPSSKRGSGGGGKGYNVLNYASVQQRKKDLISIEKRTSVPSPLRSQGIKNNTEGKGGKGASSNSVAGSSSSERDDVNKPITAAFPVLPSSGENNALGRRFIDAYMHCTGDNKGSSSNITAAVTGGKLAHDLTTPGRKPSPLHPSQRAVADQPAIRGGSSSSSSSSSKKVPLTRDNVNKLSAVPGVTSSARAAATLGLPVRSPVAAAAADGKPYSSASPRNTTPLGKRDGIDSARTAASSSSSSATYNQRRNNSGGSRTYSSSSCSSNTNSNSTGRRQISPNIRLSSNVPGGIPASGFSNRSILTISPNNLYRNVVQQKATSSRLIPPPSKRY